MCYYWCGTSFCAMAFIIVILLSAITFKKYIRLLKLSTFNTFEGLKGSFCVAFNKLLCGVRAHFVGFSTHQQSIILNTFLWDKRTINRRWDQDIINISLTIHYSVLYFIQLWVKTNPKMMEIRYLIL